MKVPKVYKESLQTTQVDLNKQRRKCFVCYYRHGTGGTKVREKGKTTEKTAILRDHGKLNVARGFIEGKKWMF